MGHGLMALQPLSFLPTTSHAHYPSTRLAVHGVWLAGAGLEPCCVC